MALWLPNFIFLFIECPGDTPGWRNNPHKPEWGHFGCKEYEENNWCENGGPTYRNAGRMGEKYNYPERNCCACGKGRRQGKS